MKKYILYQEWGGLGDNLQFSTLPEVIDGEFFIHKDNVYRNSEIYDLVWKNNPKIKGISDDPPNLGSMNIYKNYGKSYIENIELSQLGKSMKNKYPKIYYSYNKMNLNKKIVLDVSTTTCEYDISILLNKLKYDLYFKDIILLQYSNSVSKYNFSANLLMSCDCDVLVINNIFELCDIIYSCEKFITLYSGSSVLASAIKQDKMGEIVVYISEHKYIMQKKDNSYIFDNILYVTY